MTAVNIIVQKAAVHIVSDGAGIDAVGRLQVLCSKILPLPFLGAAIACRGSPAIKYLLGICIEGTKITCFDELRDQLPTIARTMCAGAREKLAQSPFGSGFDVHLVGFSGGQACAFYMRAFDLDQPWQIQDIGATIILCPCDEEMAPHIRAIFDPDQSVEEFDPALHGLKILEVQRREVRPIECGALAGKRLASIGGFAELTTVTAAGLSSRILKRWSDEIGQPIKSTDYP